MVAFNSMTMIRFILSSFYKLIDFDALTSIDFSFIILILSLNIVVVMEFFFNLKSDMKNILLCILGYSSSHNILNKSRSKFQGFSYYSFKLDLFISISET